MRNLKKVLALVLAMAMSLSLAVTAGAAYKDGDKISAKYDVAVEVASQLGILEGFEDGSYRPQENLTRAQLATMTYRLATADVTDVYTANFAGGAAENFTDTPATAWFAGYVGYAADAGYLKGMGDDTYAPNSAMTGYQALAAFLRVVGYNEPGQFTGADWTVQVAQVAYEIGALEGISNVDLNAAISREVAAQIIFNILFSDKVDYTPAFGYQNAWGEGTLASDVFDIWTEKAGVVEPTSPWGQPATVWHENDNGKAGDVIVSIAFAPVATYTEAVSECDLAKDLGLTEVFGDEKDEVIVEYLNGNNKAEVVKGSIDLVGADSKVKIGDQGTLTEVYDIDGDLWFIQIETWLGQIGETTDAKYDKNGHEKAPATAKLTIFETTNATVTLETDEFEEKDFVLVRYSAMEDEYYLTATAPVATATQTKIDANKEVSTIGGTDYNWAAHYHYGFMGQVKTEYEVFVDFYNNVIGIQKPAEADPEYTILDRGVYVTNGFNPYYAGKIVDLATGELEEVTVDTFLNQGKDALNWKDDQITYPDCIVSYTSDEDGYDLACAADDWANSYSIVKGTPRIIVGDKTYVTDAYTVYAVETACDEKGADYDMYTGYANVPSVSANAKVEILDSDDDGYVDLVYVDATAALFAGDETFAYVMTSCAPVAVGNLANDEVYKSFSNVVINGEVVDVMCAPGFNMEQYEGLAVTLKANADGLVYDAVPVEGFTPYTVAKDSSGEVIYVTDGNNEKSYVVTDETVIWVVNEKDNWAEIGSAEDVVEKAFVSIKLADGNVNADTIIVWNYDVD